MNESIHSTVSGQRSRAVTIPRPAEDGMWRSWRVRRCEHRGRLVRVRLPRRIVRQGCPLAEATQKPHPHLAWAKQDRERRAAEGRWLAYCELTGVADTPTERLNWVLKDAYSGPRIADLVYRPNALLDCLARRP